jgi:hypothetical protein
MKIPLFDVLVWVFVAFVVGIALGNCPIDKAKNHIELVEKETHEP